MKPMPSRIPPTILLLRFLVLLACLATSLSQTHAASVPPPPGLVGWWTGDGDALNRVGPPGTLSGGADFAPGKVGQAFRFNGSGQYVATTLDVQPSAMPETTWEAWVYPTTVNHSGRQQILSDDNGGYDRSVLVETGTASFGVFIGNGVWKPTAVTPNAWQHIAVVFTATNVVFYKDGTAFTLNQAPTGQGTTQRLSIGSSPSYGEFFHGLVDEVSVYNRALGPDEVAAIVAAGADGKAKTSLGTANLSVASTLTPNPASFGTGDRLTNRVVVANGGPDPAPYTVVSAAIPAGTTAASAQASAGTVQLSPAAATTFLETLPAGASVVLTVVLVPSGKGVVSAVAQATSLADDPVPADNSATATATVTGVYTATDGDWSAEAQVLADTPEAALMVRVGDIDNLGFGWPTGFSPFLGTTTPSHSYPWTPDPNDPAGTDRIMVPTGYHGTPPRGQDGYTSSTTRPGNLPAPIVFDYALGGRTVTSAALQLFVDDFQAPNWGARYQVTLNGVRCAVLEDLVNPLVQTGPVGKLITTALPAEFLPSVQSGHLELFFDDPVTGAGDGFAIDFVKLLVNVKGFVQTGTIEGTVTDADTHQPIAGAVVAAQQSAGTVADAQGHYVLANVAAGLVAVTASAPDHGAATKSVDLQQGKTVSLDFALALQPQLHIDPVDADRVRLSWAAGLSGFVLQASPTATVPGAWAPEGTTPSAVGDRLVVTNATGGAARFYRLAK